MRTLTLLFVLAALGGCVGEVSELRTDEVAYDFVASVQVNPERPTLGRAVHLQIELTSHSNQVVVTDVWVRVVRDGTRLVYEESFRGVTFHPEEVWSLSQGYLPATDDGGAPLDIEILVRDHETGELLWSAPRAATFALG